MSRPACVVCSAKPAKTSIRRRWNGFSLFGNVVPAASVVGRGVSLASVGIQPELLLPREGPFPVGVPAVVELAFVFVRPLLHDVVRAMTAPGPNT